MALTFNGIFHTPHQTIESQQIIADKVLAILQEVDHNVIVAGGAPRDWYFGNTAKDIDVYFDTSSHSVYDVTNLIETRLGSTTQIKFGDALPEGYTGNPDLVYVMDVNIKGEDVQLMGINGDVITQAIEKFPVSISQIWWKEGHYRSTEVFRIGYANKMIFKTGEEYSSKIPYMQKIKEKFTDWQCVGF